MSNVQVPVWVALVVTVSAALIGAAGPIMAQFVNAWKERKREEIRWQREQFAESVKLGQQHVAQWRENKVQIYGGFLKGLRDLEMALTRMRDATGGRYHALYTNYLEQFSVLAETASQIQLICSGQMLEFLTVQADKIGLLRVTLPTVEGLGEEALRTPENLQLIERRREFAKEYRRLFISLAREELGVRIPQLADPRDRTSSDMSLNQQHEINISRAL